MKKSICIVTEEWPGITGCGGIGTAFYELAALLERNEFKVHILFVPITEVPDTFLTESKRINFHILDVGKYTYSPFTYQKKSLAVALWLKQSNHHFSTIHFSDYKGLGFASTNLKQQGLAFFDSQLYVQLHGFTRWANEMNGTFFDHEDQLMIDHLEKNSTLNADYVVSPSRYLLNWALEKGYVQKKSNVSVIPNVCSSILNLSLQKNSNNRVHPKELIFVGRHESRKGLDLFIRSVIKNIELLRLNGVTITILGSIGTVNEIPSGLYLLNELGPTDLSISLKIDFDRFDVINYLCNAKEALVVIPSPAENSPYSVLEPLILNIPVITSSCGGALELYDSNSRNSYLFEPTIDSLAARLKLIIQKGITPAQVSTSVENTEVMWLSELQKNRKSKVKPTRHEYPLVTVGITHYERPEKIFDAVSSVLMQDYPNIEILVIDDGSKTEIACKKLEHIEMLLNRTKGRLIRQTNAYLGAARNRLIKEAKGEFIVFLDDDNYALPQMVGTLVKAICSTGTDVVTAQSVFMPLARREEFIVHGTAISEPISYVPTAGPLSLSGITNVFGDASGIYRLTVLKEIGGYTEQRDVGHEDYELYVKLAQRNYLITSCHIPTYFYEIGRESMLTKNSLVKDYQRVFKVLQAGSSKDSLIDFVQIGIGNRVRELSWNRKHWEYSNHKFSEFILPLLTAPNDKLSYVEKLSAIAQSLGYTKFLAALLTCTRQSVKVSQTQFKVQPIDQSSITEWTDDDLSGLTVACLDDDSTLFVETLSKLSQKYLNISEGATKIIFMWARRFETNKKFTRSFEAASARKFANFINREIPQKLLKIGLLNTIATAAIGVENFEIFWIFCKEIIKIENEEYLNTYPDLKDAFNNSPEKAFKHYLTNGITENRIGYKITSLLIKKALTSSELIALSLKQKLTNIEI